ncbi:MAG: DUF4129 domain-containing protein [Hyphomicrobiales bacterium]|nr:DUF4129 domain-containing protein [Hyphomicrobiales bacterium]
MPRAATYRSPAAMRALGLLCALGTAAFGDAWARTPQEIQKVADETVRRLDLQTELPRLPEPSRLSVQLPPELLWLFVAIGVGILLYAFRDLIPLLRRRRSTWSSDEITAGGVSARSVADAALEAADDLAARGQFVDAMHVLLLHGLAELRRGLGEPFADSLTSREILQRARLPDLGRSSLRAIVDRVEWTYFGEHEATAADYAACRRSFDDLAQALVGRAPA